MTFEHWQKHRSRYEIAFWCGFFALQAITNSVVSNIEVRRNGLPFAGWEPWVWEVSSNLMLLALIPLILAVDHRAPLSREQWRRHMAVHLAASLVFCVIHVLGMVALREVAYSFMGGSYNFGNWPVEFVYEYLKDVRAYASFLAMIYLYRFLVRRLQGEARFLVQGQEEDPAEVATDRFLVKKLGREFLVKVENIDWVEAAGNYVTLHVGERLYPLRETMAAIELKLSDRGFVRVHRSAIINLERIREIEPLENGDARAHLSSNATVPISRRYRQKLKLQL